MRYCVSFALMGLAFMSPSGSANAAGDVFCATYAHTAAAQQRQNAKTGCNIPNGHGLLWSASYNDQFKWCIGKSQAAANELKIKRAAALQSCFKRKGLKDTAVGYHSWCDHYSAIAVSQSKSARTNGCGYSGNRWHGDYLFHHAWCVRVPVASSKKEMAARNNMLAACAKE